MQLHSLNLYDLEAAVTLTKYNLSELNVEMASICMVSVKAEQEAQ
jgi:hypothetical protein